MYLYTGNANTAPQFTLTGSGYVGLGTTSPSYQLDLEGGQINSSGGYCIGGNCIASWQGLGNTNITWAGAQTFSANTTFPGGVWSSSGNVGIGTTSASALLTLQSTTPSAPLLSVSTSIGPALYVANPPATPTPSPNTVVVGIGTTTPTLFQGPVLGQGLDIENPTGRAALRLGSGYESLGQSWEWQSTVINGAGVMNLSDLSNGDNPLTVLSNGRVGIGNTTPGYQLDVEGGQINSSGGYCIAGNCITAWPTGSSNTWVDAQTFSAIATFSSSATFSASTSFPSGIWNASGSVGIGTSAPTTPLDLVVNPTSTFPQVRIGPVGDGSSSTSLPSYVDLWSTFDVYPQDQGPRRTATIKGRFSGGTWGNEVLAFEVGTGGVNDVGNEPLERMRITGAGYVGIGTTAPVHMLQVAGTIGAEEVIVSSTGADYVFQPGYPLEPLAEVGEYIRQHQHLPDIPSAKEVQEKGVSLGEMQTKLLAKVEELTLHMIQADERNTNLERQNRELRDRMAKIEERGPEGPVATGGREAPQARH
ncbi:MAG TPA: hypothetical protein VN924_05200 [Bryobacteraceae bacterium]|nr:hypothetical protein [Bryobacteraceae bacterium]